MWCWASAVELGVAGLHVEIVHLKIARALMRLHARGIDQIVTHPTGLSSRARARTLLAELYLMQHSCHWFCRSRSLASARLMARHQTTLEQVIEAVSPTTHQSYLALIDGRPHP